MNITHLKTLKAGRYRLVTPLRSGHAATIWRAIDLQSECECAVKIVEADYDRRVQVRLENEARIAARLSHPHVVTLIDYFEEEGWTCLVMELAECSLEDWVRVYGGMPVELAIGQFLGVVDALEKAHLTGVIHRDVKPSNLLVDKSGIVKLADFGIAHLTNGPHTLTTTGAVLGSLAYMAPEQRRGDEQLGPHTDIYSLGITMAEILTGEPVVDLFAERQQQRLRLLIDGALAEVLIRATAYEASGRYSSAAAFGLALKQAVPEHSLKRVQGVDQVVESASQEPQESELEDVEFPLSGVGWSGSRMRGATWVFMGISAAVGLILGLNLSLFLSGDDGSTRAITSSWWKEIPSCSDQVKSYHQIYHLGPRETLGVSSSDLDADGYVDQIFVNQLDESISIYWGDGQGGLGTPQVIPGARAGTAAALGDADNDGVMDMVLASADTASFAVILGSGNRQFEEPRVIFQGSEPAYPTLVDWDNDERSDLVFRHKDCLAWRKGGGSLVFDGHKCIGPSRKPVGGMDYDGDALSDLLVYGGSALTVLEASRDGWVGEEKDILTGIQGVYFPSLYDVNQDGASEVYLVPLSPDGQVIRIEGPAWEPCILGPTAYWNRGTYSLQATDVNDDRVVDFVSSRSCAGCTSNHVVHKGHR